MRNLFPPIASVSRWGLWHAHHHNPSLGLPMWHTWAFVEHDHNFLLTHFVATSTCHWRGFLTFFFTCRFPSFATHYFGHSGMPLLLCSDFRDMQGLACFSDMGHHRLWFLKGTITMHGKVWRMGFSLSLALLWILLSQLNCSLSLSHDDFVSVSCLCSSSCSLSRCDSLSRCESRMRE